MYIISILANISIFLSRIKSYLLIYSLNLLFIKVLASTICSFTAMRSISFVISFIFIAYAFYVGFDEFLNLFHKYKGQLNMAACVDVPSNSSSNDM